MYMLTELLYCSPPLPSPPSPGHPKPELVMLQVFCNGQVVAYTEFEYYQTIDAELQSFYHMLNSNLPGFFPTMGGMGGYGMLPHGGQGGEGMTGASGYGFCECREGVTSCVRAV